MDSRHACPSDQLTLFDDAACGLVQTDGRGLLWHTNQVFCDWLGYTKEELIGLKNIDDLLSVAGRAFHQTHLLPLLRWQSSISEVRIEALNKRGQVVPMMINAVCHRRRGLVVHEIAFFVARDRDRYEQELIAARLRLEDAVEKAHQLESQAKDQALLAEQMVGIVSHDLKNPLSAMLMNAALLQRSAPTADQSHVLKRLFKAGHRANRLIIDLLDFTQARLGHGLAISVKPINLETCIGEAVEELSQSFPEQQLRHVHQGVKTCKADADRLTQLVGNLVANAIAYGDPAHPVTVTSKVANACFSISVQNQGSPISEEIKAGLFKPMVRGDSRSAASRSVGLGLYIVSEIAKAHGGAMEITSDSCSGTLFTATMPMGPKC